MSLVKIELSNGKSVEINTLQIREVKVIKIGQFHADFGTNPNGPEISSHGVEGTKITMIDGTEYKTKEIIGSFKSRLGNLDSGLIALDAILSHLIKSVQPISALQAGPLNDKFQEVLRLVNELKIK